MTAAPERLVEFGTTLTATPGPALPLAWGTLTIGDPWWPEYPDGPIEQLGRGEHPTLLSTMDVYVERKQQHVPTSCAAAVGAVEQVVSWQPVLHDEEHVHLDSDSALGAFFDINEEEVLRPLFTDDEHMQGVYNRALEERIVAMQVDGRVVAVVFLCPAGSGLYPAWTGYDKDMQAVAVLWWT